MLDSYPDLISSHTSFGKPVWLKIARSVTLYHILPFLFWSRLRSWIVIVSYSCSQCFRSSFSMSFATYCLIIIRYLVQGLQLGSKVTFMENNFVLIDRFTRILFDYFFTSFINFHFKCTKFATSFVNLAFHTKYLSWMYESFCGPDLIRYYIGLHLRCMY